MKNNLPPGLQQLLILPEFSGIMNIDSLVQNFPGCGGVNIHQAACYCGFPGTGFPYQSQDLAFINLKRNIIDCVNSDFPGKRKAVPSDFLLRSKFLYSIGFGCPFIKQPCGSRMGIGNGKHRRHFLIVDSKGVFIPAGIIVSVWRIDQCGRHAGNGIKL